MNLVNEVGLALFRFGMMLIKFLSVVDLIRLMYKSNE